MEQDDVTTTTGTDEAAEALVADELLVEEISIDGMCASTDQPTESISRQDRVPVLTLDAPLELHPQVALRPEPFGALAYHYGNRRLIFLKHPTSSRW